MKFSRNPSTGVLEVYTDDGIYVGTMATNNGGASVEMAMDGGPGSGNFNHEGRPGLVGGSGAGEGGSGPIIEAHFERTDPRYLKRYEAKKSYTFKPKAFKVDRPSRPTESGKKYGDDLLKKYEMLPGDGIAPKNGEAKFLLAQEFYPKEWYKLEDEDRITEPKLMEHVRDVYVENGSPELPEGKTRPKSNLDDRMVSKLDDDKRIKYLTALGYSEKEAKKVDDALVQYTEGDWKKVDQSILEDYIERSKVVTGSALYRGVVLTDKEMDDLLETVKTGVISMGGVVSWSKNPKRAREFADPNWHIKNGVGDKHSVVFQIAGGSNRHGVDIGQFSKFGESEVITPSKATYSVLSVLTIDDVSTGNGGFSDNDLDSVTFVSLLERGAEYDE